MLDSLQLGHEYPDRITGEDSHESVGGGKAGDEAGQISSRYWSESVVEEVSLRFGSIYEFMLTVLG
jgi:hypothetical protein